MAPPSTVIGHEEVLAWLEAARADGALPHALLLSGPSGVGKTTVAIHLADDILDGAAWPGGLPAHPDLWLEDSDAERIGIDRIRAGARAEAGPSLQDVMNLRTYAGGMKSPCWRAPSVSPSRPPTRFSRPWRSRHRGRSSCSAPPTRRRSRPPSSREPSRYRSRPCPSAESSPGSRPAASNRAWPGWPPRCPAGVPAGPGGWRPSPGALVTEVEALHAFLAIAGGGLDGALRAAAELTPGAGAEGRERALLLLAVWSSFVRDAALQASAVTESRLWADYAEPLERWAESLGAARLTDILGSLLRAGTEIAQYAQPRLTFEALFLDIFAGPEPPPPVEMPAVPAAVADAPEAAPPSTRPARPSTRGPSRRR